MNAAEIARAVFSRGTTTNGEQIVFVDGLTIEDVYVLCRAVLDAEEVSAKYHELLYAVGNVYPDETRHQTALRYIQQFESQASIGTEVREKRS
ncbi:MAG: hypothetical protein ACYCUI_13695 [Vulcanimicrobiaceae bacterium]